MAEPEVSPDPAQSTAPETPPDPIAEILTKYPIEETAQQFRQNQPETSTQPKPETIPDPYDTENFKNHLMREAQANSQLRSQVQALGTVLSQIQARESSAKIESDIQAAVKAVDEIAQLGEPELIEAYLDAKVRKDPRMHAIWDNREKNPKAYQEALKVVGKEAAEKFSVKTDPNLVEAQRARKAAQSTIASTTEEDKDEKWGKLQGADFDRAWERLKGSMN